MHHPYNFWLSEFPSLAKLQNFAKESKYISIRKKKKKNITKQKEKSFLAITYPSLLKQRKTDMKWNVFYAFALSKAKL